MGFKGSIAKVVLGVALTAAPALLVAGVASARGDSYAFVLSEVKQGWNKQFPTHKRPGETISCDYNRNAVKAGYAFNCQIYSKTGSEIGHVHLVTQTHRNGYDWGYATTSWPY
jgi:hypothetical protein